MLIARVFGRAKQFEIFPVADAWHKLNAQEIG